MHAASGGKGPPQFLSTHPSGKSRIQDLQKHIPYAMLFMRRRGKQVKGQSAASEALNAS